MLELRASLHRSRIRPDVATELNCQLELRPSAELGAGAGSGLAIHLCLVFDCSGSMAGAKAEAAIAAAHLIVDSIADRSRISLVGFSTSHWTVVDNACPAETGREPIKAQIDRLRDFIRGGTNLAEGIRRGIRLVQRYQADAHVIVVLSDGEADSPAEAVQAGIEASRASIQVFAVGVGDDFRADDLLEVVRPSNGGVLGERDLGRLDAAFRELLGRMASFVATNAQLVVTLREDVSCGAVYKTSPERMFLGQLPLEEGAIRLHVGNVERGEVVAFLLTLTPPIGRTGELELGRATLRYDLPAARLRGQEAEVAFVVNYDTRADSSNPAVMLAYRRAQVAELVDALADAERQQDRAKSIELLEVLRRRSEAQRDTRLVEALRGLSPPIAQADLNTLILAATVRDAAPIASPAVGAPPPPPRVLHDVILVESGASVIELLREIRDLTGLGLAQIHDMITNPPSTIIALAEDAAHAVKKRLEAAGARIEIAVSGPGD